MVERIVGIFISVVVGSSVIFMDNLPGTDYQERETVIVMETEPQVTEYDKVLFAQIVMAEAGDQGLYGKRLVVDVILNKLIRSIIHVRSRELLARQGNSQHMRTEQCGE